MSRATPSCGRPKLQIRRNVSAVGKKIHSECLMDRISNLHDNLKEKILECLPLTDAMKTSVLSRKWRRSWTGMECLVFDESFVKSMGSLTQARFTRIIERILLLHRGSLQYFYVDIPQHFNSVYMNGWFVSLSRIGVTKLDIVCTRNITPLFSIPANFFDCGGLTDLVLEVCRVRLPVNFQGFHNLASLHLVFVDTSSNELAEFISRCPRLEILSLLDVFYYFSEPLDLSAPNLRTLLIEDYVSGMIKLKNTPSLTIVSLKWLEGMRVVHKKIYSSMELLCSLSRIEDLTFDLLLHEPLVGECLENKLVALKTLALGRVNICKRDDILSTFLLLRSSPNLKTLNISLHHVASNDRDDEVSVKCLESEEKKGYSLNQLVNVKITGITGLRCETMLVNTLLSRCPILETLLIEPIKDIKHEAEMKMSWELNRSRRLSRHVELVYSLSQA